MADLFQIGDHVLTLAAFAGIPQSTEGIILKCFHTAPEIYWVQFENPAIPVALFRATLLVAAPSAPGHDTV